jgi:phosphoribosylanthranilate isomerase
MPRTRVKFCGFTRPEDILAAVAAGVDAIGLNFARGPRRIDTALGATLAALIPPYVQAVALFVDADEAHIRAVLAETRCTSVQLHGDEPEELAARLRRDFPVVKAARVASAADLTRLMGYPADAFLLDAQVAGSHGGTGHAWDHRLLAGLDLGAPVILAGGLNPATVAAAIGVAHPFAVDTASGIESAPGIKDPAAMTAFLAAVRSADAAAPG